MAEAGRRSGQVAEVAGRLEQLLISLGGAGVRRLPSERMLAERFSVSRATVREAIRLLEGQGRVQVSRRGVAPADPVDVPPEVGPLDVLEARFAVEPAVARLAAQRASPLSLERVRARVDACRAAVSGDAFEEMDEAFHLEVARASRSLLLVRMMEAITQARHVVRWGERKLDQERMRQQYCDEHAAIAAALLERDGARAHEAAYRHLESVADHLVGAGR